MESGAFECEVDVFKKVVVNTNELALVARNVSDIREAESRLSKTEGLVLEHE